MREFVALVDRLDKTNRTKEKQQYLSEYFRSAPKEDLIWVVALFTHRRPRGVIKLAFLKQWAMEISGLPEWLFQESYHYVGDLAETLSLLGKVENSEQSNLNLLDKKTLGLGSLHSIFQRMLEMKKADVEEQKQWVLSVWRELESMERFVFNKFLTGGFRIGVSEQLLFKSIAEVEGLSVLEVQHRLMGNWKPEEVSYRDLVEVGRSGAEAVPFPFALCYSLEELLVDVSEEVGLDDKLGKVDEWQVEWKWDGIRAQLVKRGKNVWLWSRGEELINEMFPEVNIWQELLVGDVVLDGELLVWVDGRPASFQQMQRRLGRKQVGKKLLEECPVVFMSYDILEIAGEDLRTTSLVERRILMEDFLAGLDKGGVKVSPRIEVCSWEEVRQYRSNSATAATEGLMLKRQDSEYLGGRKRGAWWKWKVAAETVDCVLIYVQRGHGKRASLYTDFTFAVRDGERLVPFAKAYSGLTNAELEEINRWLKNHTRESFGPVRSVDAELVFEVAFEGISKSSRHKSGIAVRFPRIVRWRKDKTVAEIDTLDNILRKLENGRGQH
jgi:DNA ligase-1